MSARTSPAVVQVTAGRVGSVRSRAFTDTTAIESAAKLDVAGKVAWHRSRRILLVPPSNHTGSEIR